MQPSINMFRMLLFLILGAGLILGVVYFFPWKQMEWGQVTFAPANTITVTGTAELEEKTQVAHFTAGANATSDDKQAALQEVNSKVEAVIARLKEFGIAEGDIQTQNAGTYQQQEQYYEDGRQKTRPGQWYVDNTLSITLRDVDRTSELVGLLNDSGLNNVYGPNFTFDDTSATQNALLAEAVENARTKADLLAEAGGRKIKRVVSINEGYAGDPVYPMFGRLESGGGGGAPIQPGTGTVSVSVTVVFEVE